MEQLFTRGQLEKMELQAHYDVTRAVWDKFSAGVEVGQKLDIPFHYQRRNWQRGTSKMNKTQLVAYIRELWALRLGVQGLAVN